MATCSCCLSLCRNAGAFFLIKDYLKLFDLTNFKQIKYIRKYIYLMILYNFGFASLKPIVLNLNNESKI